VVLTANPDKANYRFGNPDLRTGKLDAAVVIHFTKHVRSRG